MALVVIDYISDIRTYSVGKGAMFPTTINTDNIKRYEGTRIYKDEGIDEVTRVFFNDGDDMHFPWNFEQFTAIMKKSTMVYDFRIGNGDFYVNDKSQIQSLGR